MDQQPEPIRFKPLNEGLGFHAFSDGLPYSPSVGTKKPSQGTGAVAAGRPTFVRQMPTQAELRSEPRVAARPVAQPKVTEEPVSAPIPVPVEYGLGYLFRRFAAYVLDSALNFSLSAVAISWVFWKQNIQAQAFLAPEMLLGLVAFSAFFNWALVSAQEIAFGTSAGKRIFGLTVSGAPMLVLLRAVFFLLGSVFCGLGLFWAVFDGNRRCWHDLATGIQPEPLHKS